MGSYYARTESNSANNPALNPTGDPSILITFVAETPTGDPGDNYLDQPTGGGIDPDTVLSIDGNMYTFSYELLGTLPTQKKHGSQQVPDQYEGSDVVIITVYDYPAVGESTRLFFLPNEDATQAEMDAFGTGSINVQNVDETPPPTAVCFLRGTRIQTPRGLIPVEDLRIGDLVDTLDAGPLPVRWIGRTSHVWPGSSDDSKPIRISSGAMGDYLPERELTVSPQHKLLLGGESVRRETGTPEVLAPAKGLVALRGVRRMAGCRSAVYLHLMLDRHAIIFAEGMPTESFFPGKTALAMLTDSQRREIFRRFPKLRRNPISGYSPTVRACLTRRKTEELIAAAGRDGRLFTVQETPPCIVRGPELAAV